MPDLDADDAPDDYSSDSDDSTHMSDMSDADSDDLRRFVNVLYLGIHSFPQSTHSIDNFYLSFEYKVIVYVAVVVEIRFVVLFIILMWRHTANFAKIYYFILFAVCLRCFSCVVFLVVNFLCFILNLHALYKPRTLLLAFSSCMVNV